MKEVLLWSIRALVTLDTKMKILGIDPALRTTGFGIIQSQGQRLSYIASGTIETGSSQIPVPDRIATLYSGIREVVETYQPDLVSMEQVFLNVNPRSTLLLGQARGAAIAALVATGIPLLEFSALEIKKSIVGTGRAKKEQVQEMVRRLLSMKKITGTDASDALAAAICAAHQYEMKSKLQNLAQSAKIRR